MPRSKSSSPMNLTKRPSPPTWHAKPAPSPTPGHPSIVSTQSKSLPIPSGAVLVNIGTIKNEETVVLVSQPTNPTIFEMSSYFSLCLKDGLMDKACDKTFGKVVFPSSPVMNTPTPTTLFPVAESLSSKIVGKSSTYQFKFSFSKQYK